jgi:hypothetical protein
MPYLISTSPVARTNRAPEDDIDRVPYIHERERWILKQARQSAARRILIIRLWAGRSFQAANRPPKSPFDILACDELDRSLHRLNGIGTDALANGWTRGSSSDARSGRTVL